MVEPGEALPRLTALGSLVFHLRLAEAVAGSARQDLAADAWAVDVGSDGYEVTGLRPGPSWRVAVRITFDAEGAAIVERGRGRASPRQIALAAARRTALATAASLAPKTAAIVLPPRYDEPWDGLDAYILSTAASPDDLVAGPHWRARLSASGEDVLSVEIECGLGPTIPPDAYRRGDLVIRHEGRTPSPLHVALSLEHGAGFEVACEPFGARWRIDGERARII